MTEWMAWTKNCFAPGCEYSQRGVRHRHSQSGDLQVYGEGGTKQSQGWTKNCGRPGCSVSKEGEWHRHLEDGATVTAGADASRDVTAQRIVSTEMHQDTSRLLRDGVIYADPSKNETLWVNGVAQSKWCKRCGQTRSYPDSPFCRFHDPEIELATVPPDVWQIKEWAGEIMEQLLETWEDDDEKVIPWNDYGVVVHISKHLYDILWWQSEQKQWRMIMGDTEYFCKTDAPMYWMTHWWSMGMNELIGIRRKKNVSVRSSYVDYVSDCFKDEHASRLIGKLKMVLTR